MVKKDVCYSFFQIYNDQQHPGTETTGIEVHHVYWPMKIGSRAMLFRLELWDAGEASSKRYNHIKPVSFLFCLCTKF